MYFQNVKEDQLRCVRRPVRGQDEQVVDQFDRVDHRIHLVEKCRGHQQRQHDAAGIASATGALDVGGYFQVFGYCLQCGEAEDHAEPRFCPDGRDDDGPMCCSRLAQPLARYVEDVRVFIV